MGLMDSLKKASGLGLSPHEHYNRAYEKGVLLGETQYTRAIALFDAAASKASEAGDQQLQHRARANAAIYRFVTTGSNDHLANLKPALASLTEIEEIGSRTTMMPTAPLIAEIGARLIEAEALAQAQVAPSVLAGTHFSCAAAFKPLLGVPLLTYKYSSPDKHTATGDERYFFHQGLAFRFEAMDSILSDPETAAESMAKALSSFRQCNDAEGVLDTEQWLTNLRQQRTCWVCHREFQGAKVHFDLEAARVTVYADAVGRRLGQDSGTIDLSTASIVLCRLCRSVIDGIADKIATVRVDALRDWAVAGFDSHGRAISTLSDRVRRLELK